AMARKREERFRSVEAMARAFVVAAQPLIPQSASIERRTYPMGEMGAYRDGPRLIGPSPQGIDLGTFSRVPLKQPITQSREKREEEKNSASATIDPASVATSLPTESIASLDGDRLVEHQDGGIHPQAPKRTNFSRPKRLLLIVAGFAVLSALMAIWVLGRKESTKTLPSTKNGAISSDHLVGVGTPAQNGEATRAKVQKEDPTPSPPASPNGESTPSPKGQRVTRLKNSKGVGEENLTNSEPTAHPPPTPDYESILKLAQDSLRAGNPKHCVELLNDLIARFPLPIALRQRADCLLEMGEREAAIRDYRRFCRFAPEHPSVEEVRAAVQKLGVGCP
ncbi:MAG: hypothetical protein N2515_05915, partial [Deltaproteobacteria bacterium]|nr:hypothetical protein [Deltaproteobacteria bacterium]